MSYIIIAIIIIMLFTNLNETHTLYGSIDQTINQLQDGLMYWLRV